VWGGNIHCTCENARDPLVRYKGQPHAPWCYSNHKHEWTNKRWYAAQGNAASSAAAFTEAGTDNAKRLKDARWHDNNTCEECGAWLGSLGLEPTPELYIEHLVECFREVRRVLRDDATCWVNLGDSYAGSGKGPTGHNGIGDQEQRQGFRADRSFNSRLTAGKTTVDVSLGGGGAPGYKPKDLLMIPFRVAMALQADGWYLRSVIPWLKRNSMPESVVDRPSTSTEYVFLLAKSSRYFWDADAVRKQYQGALPPNHFSRHPTTLNKLKESDGSRWASDRPNDYRGERNRRNSDWWFESWQGLLLDETDDPLALVVNPAPYTGAHFATFPPKLVEPMIKASTSEKGQCPECGAPWVRVTNEERHVLRLRAGEAKNVDNGTPPQGGYRGFKTSSTTGWRPSCSHTAEPVPQTCLDPFGGAGTVGLVADRLQRNAILCELKADYAALGSERIIADGPLFADLTDS
jgi:DNA modification methylase